MRDQIIEEIRKIAAMNGGHPPGFRTFSRETGIGMGVWRGTYWARWSEAVTEAGFEPNKQQPKFSDNFITQKLVSAIRHFGRIPTNPELRLYRKTIDPTFPNDTVLNRRFHAKTAMLDQLATWIEGDDQFSDVASMLSGIKQSTRGAEPPTIEGFVYLIKSGAHYKIGRSDQIERRIREIRIALPETAKMIHTIRTDDPAGIETYWHRRFENKRANGEWFKLSAADVSAFKRRKFQ